MLCSRVKKSLIYYSFVLVSSTLGGCGGAKYLIKGVSHYKDDYDTFNRDLGSQKIDILFVVDNSGSMQDNQEILSNSMADFIDEFVNRKDENGNPIPSIDFHIGTITTDSYMTSSTVVPDHLHDGAGTLIRGYEGMMPVASEILGLPKFLSLPERSEVSEDEFEEARENIIKQFQLDSRPGTVGSGAETPLLSIVQFLQEDKQSGWNKGFLRDDSFVAIIVVTDEDESIGPCAANSMDPWLRTAECANYRGSEYLEQIAGANTSRYDVFREAFMKIRPDDPDFLSLDVVVAEGERGVFPSNGFYLKDVANKIKELTATSADEDRVHSLLNSEGFGKDIQKIGKNLASKVGHTFKLDSTNIDIDTLKVSINGVYLRPDQYSYNTARKRLILSADAYDGFTGEIKIRVYYEKKLNIAYP